MAYQSKHTGATIDNAIDQVAQLLNIFYPIGSIYTSTKSTSPATLFGGTWVQIKDTFLLTAGDKYSAGATGGSATHTHTSAAHTHTTAGHTLTVAETPAHTHTRGTMNITGGFAPWSEGSGASITQPEGAFYSIGSNQYGWGTTTGRDQDNEFIKFDASRSWTGSTSSVGGSGSHSHGDTGSTTPGNTGSSSNLPPYKVVYAWERTA